MIFSECVGNLNNREIYADKIYLDIPFYKETQECKKLLLFTPKSYQRRITWNNQKGEKRKRLVSNCSLYSHTTHLIIVQLVEWKNKYSKSDEGQIYI